MIALGWHSLAGYAWTTWAPTFILRVHHMPLAQVGGWLGLATAVGVICGTAASTIVADRKGIRDPRWFLLVPAGRAVLSAIFAVATALMPSGPLAIMLYVPMVASFATWAPVTYPMAQTLADTRARALAAAVVGFFSVFIGTGLGPMVVGILNDALAPMGPTAIRYSLLLMVPALLVGGCFFTIAARHAAADFARRADRPV